MAKKKVQSVKTKKWGKKIDIKSKLCVLIWFLGIRNFKTFIINSASTK